MTKLALLVVCACASALAVASAGRLTGAAFTASVAVDGNTVKADQLSNYFRVTPGNGASGDVDTLTLDLGVVRTLSVDRVFTVTNVGAAAADATLMVAGLPQVAAATFRSTGTSTATLAPGESTDVSVALSPQVAGPGNGTLRLGLTGSTWLYRTYPLKVTAAPQPPATLTASARAGGLVTVGWAASVTTTNLGGYDVYRSSAGGAFTKIASVPATQTSYDDRATADGTAYGYRVRAVATGDATLDSLDSPAATATADATPPGKPFSVALANGGGNGGAFVNASNRSAISVAVSLREPARDGDTVSVTVSAGGSNMTRTATVGAGATTATVGGFDLSSVPDGSLTFSATATDAAGNTSSAVAGQASKDTAAPSAPTALYVDLRSADFIGGVAEPGATVSAVRTLPSGGGPYQATASSSGLYAVAVPNAGTDDVSYSVTATDAAGNTSSSTTVSP